MITKDEMNTLASRVITEIDRLKSRPKIEKVLESIEKTAKQGKFVYLLSHDDIGEDFLPIIKELDLRGFILLPFSHTFESMGDICTNTGVRVYWGI